MVLDGTVFYHTGGESYSNFLCILYGPVHNAYDASSIHYEGKWEGVESSLEIESFLGPR
jgi:hypothetical protein